MHYTDQMSDGMATAHAKQVRDLDTCRSAWWQVLLNKLLKTEDPGKILAVAASVRGFVFSFGGCFFKCESPRHRAA